MQHTDVGNIAQVHATNISGHFMGYAVKCWVCNGMPGKLLGEQCLVCSTLPRYAGVDLMNTEGLLSDKTTLPG